MFRYFRINFCFYCYNMLLVLKLVVVDLVWNYEGGCNRME